MKEIRKAPTRAPERCNDCRSYWAGSRRPGYRNVWCCKYGKGATQAQSLCLAQNGKDPK